MKYYIILQILYNFANILNSIMKLNLYKTWNDKDNKDTNHDKEFVHYEIKYKTEFKEDFWMLTY